MTRIGTSLAAPALVVAGWLVLWWAWAGVPDASATAVRSLFFLMAGEVLALPTLVLLLQAPWRSRPGWRHGLLVTLLVVGVFAATTRWLLGDRVAAAWPSLVAAVGAFGAAIYATWVVDHYVLGGVTRGLLPLAAGGLLLFAPFCLEGYLAGYPDPMRAATVIEAAATASPLVTSSTDALGVDLFKEDAVYRRFRVGEHVFRYPTLGATGRLLTGLALALIALALVVAAGRRLARDRRDPSSLAVVG